MKRILDHALKFIPFILASLLLTGCNSKEAPLGQMEAELGIDLSGGKLLSEEDSHGGFHGDGTGFFVVQFEEDNLKEQLKDAPGWKEIPFDQTAQILLYGYDTGEVSQGPYVTDGEGEPLVPPIEEGFYWLKDRQAEEGKAAGADLLYRSSLNFTIAVYDSQAKRLYYCRVDT